MLNRFNLYIILSLALLIIGIGACSGLKDNDSNMSADSVFINGRIYTVDNKQPWVNAVAVKNGKYIARGSDKHIQHYIGPKTKVVDLKGKMMMPGINDAHSHLYGGIKELFYCNFPVTSNLQQIKVKLTQCVNENPEKTFIMGGYWASDFFDDNKLASPRLWLDDISTDIAIILSDDSGHNAWVNSKALQAVGFNKESKNPIDGTIVRDNNGEPNGILYESVVLTVEEHFNASWTESDNIKGMQHVLKTANKYGITGIKDAATRKEDLIALNTIAQQQGLTAHVATALYTPYGSREKPLNYDYYSELASKYKTKNLYTNSIKFFLDGVPTSSRTAAMLKPYATDKKHSEVSRGDLHLYGDLLANDLAELDKRGFTIKLHAAGDRSVQEALNAIEYVRKTNGNKDKMHEIAHAGFVDDQDIHRFKQLNVAVDSSPYLWYPSLIIDNIHSVLGDYTQRYWQNRKMLDIGATIIAGSDWPSVSPTVNPWPGIEATVTRKNPYDEHTGVFVKEQALTLAETITIFTKNGARALDLAGKTGAITVGQYADFIILNHNIFEIAPEKIGDTKIKQTWFQGKQVYNGE